MPTRSVLLWDEPISDSEAPWIAVCLEHFLLARGATFLEALAHLRTALAHDIHSGAAFRPAPTVYSNMWDKALPIVDPPDRGLMLPASAGVTEFRLFVNRPNRLAEIAI